MSIVSVYAIFADVAEAERIGRAVIDERLAACINIFAPVRSIYRWQGAIESSEEIAAILKTSDECAERLVARIAELHSYELPCIASWPIETILAGYAGWVKDNVD